MRVFRWWMAVGSICSALSATAFAQPVSQAEQLLFLDPHLKNVDRGSALRYRHAHSGSLEPAFDGPVVVTLSASERGQGKRAHVDYLAGPRAFVLPDVEDASGNPVILSFLERDVREMQRLTGGQPQYFRKRLRIALAEAAMVEPATIDLAGEAVPATRIRIVPFEQDPMKQRFAALAAKTYVFTLSDAVPGGVYEIQAVAQDRRRAPADGAVRPPLSEDTLTFFGVDK